MSENSEEYTLDSVDDASPDAGTCQDIDEPSQEEPVNEEEAYERRLTDALFRFPPELLRENNDSAPGTRPKRGLKRNLAPIDKIEEIFDDITVRAIDNGLGRFLNHIGSRELRVATMCSGTEAPLLALEMIMDSLERIFGRTFRMKHLFSAEIDPFKQSYIQRNFNPDIIFRDVNELVTEEATTAFGSVRQVPADPDLLVVGFSCVDFSQLNSHRKTLEEMGESGHTFYGVLRYVQRCRPPLVILENVCGAPWSFIQLSFQRINYLAHHIKVDTKNYYLPQTRERGYMFCMDQSKLEGGGYAEACSFSDMMKKFERPASSSVTQFMLKDGDPRLQDALTDIASYTVKDRQSIDWTRYKARHLAYRMREGLGDRRPLTRYQDNGTCQMPDFFCHPWSKRQTERVWDTLDMNYLRTLIRGYDINFKSRIVDLSQGVDRELDNRASGLAGCLTPRGLHFITSRGRPLLGIEALALQGIPIDRLLLSNDPQKDLYDLAGNAMSSTVVGAAIMCALIIGYKALESGEPSSESAKDDLAAEIEGLELKQDDIAAKQPSGSSRKPTRRQLAEETPQPELMYDGSFVELAIDLSETSAISIQEIIAAAWASSRLCLCEGQAVVKRSGLQRCSLCGHTACTKCGRNPSHRYEPISPDELNARIHPIQFETMLKTKLPMRLQMNGLDVSIFSMLQANEVTGDARRIWADLRRVIEPALGDELRFSGVTRDSNWVVTYQGVHSTLQLTCSPANLEWSFYIMPPRNEPSNSSVRQILRLPVARMRPSGNSLLSGRWRIYALVSSCFNVAISGWGKRVPSIGSRAGLQHPDFIDTKVWSWVCITAEDKEIQGLEFDIRGDYELLQDCGAASGSLHKRVSPISESDLYFFLDPTDIGPAEFDPWVFAHDHKRLDVGQSRLTIAETRPGWTASSLSKEPKDVLCWYRKWVDREDVSLSVYHQSLPAVYTIPGICPEVNVNADACAKSYLPMLSCSVPGTGLDLQSVSGGWKIIDLMKSPMLLAQFSWLLQRAISVQPSSQWTPVGHQAAQFVCSLCSPKKPRLKWALGDKKHVCPYEDPEDAAVYERNITARPPPFLAFTNLDGENVFHLRIGLNVLTLLHQARGKLSTTADVSLQWRLCIDNFGFLRQRLPKIQELNNKDDDESSQPPGFQYYPLRPEQLRSLTWMKELEKNTIEPFREEEVVEAMLPVINWRAEGRVTTDKKILGGILGDHVGYGKTAVILGLIDSQFEADSESVPEYVDGAIPVKATLIVVPNHLVDQWSREIKKFLGPKYNVLEIKNFSQLKKHTIRRIQIASIILLSTSVLRGDAYYAKMELFAACPALPKGQGRIFEEWMKDAMVGVRDHVNVLRDTGAEALHQSIMGKFAELKKGHSYTKYKPSKRLKGRRLQEYLAKFKEEIGSTMDNSSTTAPGGGGMHQWSSSKINKSSNEVAAGKKRKSPPDASEDEADKPSAKSAKFSSDDTASSKPIDESIEDIRKEVLEAFQLKGCMTNWRGFKSTLIHMFEFSRVVIDEFTYSRDRNYTAVLAIPARKKWILSGTPPLNDFADVKSISPFLNITLGVDDEDDRKSENERLRAIQREQTDAEQFQPFVTRHSAAWHERRHGIAQNFLNRFMRKNTPQIDEIPWSEHIVEVVLSPAERATYLELFMQLISQNLKLGRSGKRMYSTTEHARLEALMKNSESPEEALLKCSCLFTADDGLSIAEVSDKTGYTPMMDVVARPLAALEGNAESGTGVLNSAATPLNITSPDEHVPLSSARRQQFENLMADIANIASKGLWLRSQVEDASTHFDRLLEDISSHRFGEITATSQINNVVLDLKKAAHPSDGHKFYLTPAEKKKKEKEKDDDPRLEFPKLHSQYLSELNSCADNLRRLVYEAVSRVRAFRLFESVRDFQRTSPTSTLGCSSCSYRALGTKQFAILGQCGHTCCEPCLKKCNLEEVCQVAGCNGSVQGFRIIKPSDIGHEEDNSLEVERNKYGGSKFAALIRLLKDATQIGADEQVILFIQFADVVEAASSALCAADIPHMSISPNDKKSTAKKIAEFQAGTEEIKSKVLILHLGDVTASGLNLQMVNHVIFFSPLCARSQYDYDSGMAQAIGRARRYGQLRHVHIYHFLALNTIDVNIFEQRRRQHVVKRDGKFVALSKGEILATDEVGWRGSSLDGTNAEPIHDSGYDDE